jgi:outer membrane protein OmpA-like peptidoglycan-associated protein
MRYKCSKIFTLLVAAFFPVVMLYPQTATEMDGLLETKAVSFSQACRFVLIAAGAADENAAPQAAFTQAREWLPGKAEAGSPIRLGELSFLIMKAFNMKGSFLYALFPGPRYAFRELDYLKLLPGRRDPALTVSGEYFLQILGTVLTYQGESFAAFDPESVTAEGEAPEAAETPAALTETREQIAAEIRTELSEQGVADTSVQAAGEGVTISLNNIQFLPDSAELTEAEKVKIMQIGIILSRYPDRKILVAGHTAMAGSEENRQRISTERARAVADFLAYLDVRRREEISVRGYGALRPLGDNAAEEGRALNRRVEIILLDKERP